MSSISPSPVSNHSYYAPPYAPSRPQPKMYSSNLPPVTTYGAYVPQPTFSAPPSPPPPTYPIVRQPIQIGGVDSQGINVHNLAIRRYAEQQSELQQAEWEASRYGADQGRLVRYDLRHPRAASSYSHTLTLRGLSEQDFVAIVDHIERIRRSTKTETNWKQVRSEAGIVVATGGLWGIMLACNHKKRTSHAVEPIQTYLDSINARMKRENIALKWTVEYTHIIPTGWRISVWDAA